MKRSKVIAGFLALITGVFGFHRFYLGQYCRGAVYILFPSVVALVVALLSGTADILKHTETDVSISLLNRIFYAPILFYIPVLLVAVIEAILFFIMKNEKFDQRHNVKKSSFGVTLGISLGVIAVCGLVLMLIFNKFYSEPSVNVRDAEAAFTFTSSELASKFNQDEEAAYADYNMTVIAVSGVILEDFIDVATDARTLILTGDTELNIKCNFFPDQQAAVKELVIGQQISIKGYCLQKLNDEIIMNDCLLIDAKQVPVNDLPAIPDSLDVVIE